MAALKEKAREKRSPKRRECVEKEKALRKVILIPKTFFIMTNVIPVKEREKEREKETNTPVAARVARARAVVKAITILSIPIWATVRRPVPPRPGDPSLSTTAPVSISRPLTNPKPSLVTENETFGAVPPTTAFC